MTKDVLVTVRGVQQQNGEYDKTEIITVGSYYKRNGTHYLLYEEMLEGFDEPVKNMVKFSEGKVSVQKRGAITTLMTFEEMRKNHTNYVVPYGNVMVGIDTKNIHIQEQEEHIELRVEYAMEVNYEYLADLDLTIDIKAKREGMTFSLS